MKSIDSVVLICLSWLAMFGTAWAQDQSAETASSVDRDVRTTLSVADTPQSVSEAPGAEPTDTAVPRLQLRDSTGASSSETREWFRMPLAIAYATPVALIVASAVLPALTGPSAAFQGILLVTAIPVLLLVPPLVHLLNDDGLGALAALAGTVGFTLPLAILGGWWVYSACPNEYEDQCIGYFAAGAWAGGLVGYATWATLDTVFWAYAVKDSPRSSRLSPYVAPLLRATRSDQAPRVHGVVVGAVTAF